LFLPQRLSSFAKVRENSLGAIANKCASSEAAAVSTKQIGPDQAKQSKAKQKQSKAKAKQSKAKQKQSKAKQKQSKAKQSNSNKQQ